MLVDVVLLIGGVCLILGVAVLARTVQSFAKGAARARLRAAQARFRTAKAGRTTTLSQPRATPLDGDGREARVASSRLADRLASRP